MGRATHVKVLIFLFPMFRKTTVFSKWLPFELPSRRTWWICSTVIYSAFLKIIRWSITFTMASLGLSLVLWLKIPRNGSWDTYWRKWRRNRKKFRMVTLRHLQSNGRIGKHIYWQEHKMWNGSVNWHSKYFTWHFYNF